MKSFAVLALSLVVVGCNGDSNRPNVEPTDTITQASAGFFTQVSAGYDHACGVTGAGAVYCWGWARGIFGGQDPEHDAAARPTRIATMIPFNSLSAGGGMACGLVVTLAWCWGDNELGQLGVGGVDQMCGSTPCQPTPTRVASPGEFEQIAAGGGHTCGLAPGGIAYCWGYNSHGRLGVDVTTYQRTPVQVNTSLRFQRIAASGTHTCGITTEGEAFCWGYGETGQIGHGANTAAQTTPAHVAGGHVFTDISAHSSYTCALRLDGAVFCWGANTNGQLGNGTTSNSNVPVRAGVLPFTSVTAGSGHACAIAGDGSGYCWGDNAGGQIGDGTTTDRTEPTRISTTSRFTQLTAGSEFTCGITTDGEAVCWGVNYGGALGIGSEEPLSATTPRRVAAPIL